jgi:hypothetical protein
MELTREQKIRVQNFIPGFYRYILEGTIAHCQQLKAAGMIAEAREILQDFVSEDEAKRILEN